jgi:hypothetical protein
MLSARSIAIAFGRCVSDQVKVPGDRLAEDLLL